MTVERVRKRTSRLAPRHKVMLVGGAAFITAAGSCGAISYLSSRGGPEAPRDFSQTIPEDPENRTRSQPTPTSPPAPTETPEARWDCVTIDNSDPKRKNAYRAVLLAGDPDIVENGHYLHIDNGGGVHDIDNLGELDHRYGGKYVYNGEQVCVEISDNVISNLRENRALMRKEITQEVKVSVSAARSYEREVRSRKRS